MKTGETVYVVLRDEHHAPSTIVGVYDTVFAAFFGVMKDLDATENDYSDYMWRLYDEREGAHLKMSKEGVDLPYTLSMQGVQKAALPEREMPITEFSTLKHDNVRDIRRG